MCSFFLPIYFLSFKHTYRAYLFCIEPGLFVSTSDPVEFNVHQHILLAFVGASARLIAALSTPRRRRTEVGSACECTRELLELLELLPADVVRDERAAGATFAHAQRQTQFTRLWQMGDKLCQMKRGVTGVLAFMLVSLALKIAWQMLRAGVKL